MKAVVVVYFAQRNLRGIVQAGMSHALPRHDPKEGLCIDLDGFPAGNISGEEHGHRDGHVRPKLGRPL
eukprot:42361-Eustigmatos_ZCMA.PRE.1